MRKILLLVLAVMTMTLMISCGGRQPAEPTVAQPTAEEPTKQPTDVPPTPEPMPLVDLASLQVLANLEYQSQWTDAGTVQLENGEYSESIVEGSASKLTVRLTQHIATGELDGEPAAAVILVTNSGGSGTFVDLAVVVEQDGQPVNVAVTSLGDRARIYALTIEDGEIVVEMVTHGPDDPMCCPTQWVRETYALEGDELVQTSSEVLGTVEPGEVGIAPVQIRLDTQDLPYAWQANIVPETPYDQSQPPGPKGLPEHIQVNFGVTDPADRQYGDPVMYIIPVDADLEMWGEAGSDHISRTVAAIYRMALALPHPAPTSGMPVLPVEEVGGVNDLAVQVGRAAETASSATKGGYRFVGRFAQDATPVIGQGLRYIYQGFTNDGEYLVAFFYPVSTSELPASAEEVSAEDWDSFNLDPQAHIAQKARMLNGLDTSAWEPDLATLDAVVGSLQVVGMPASGLQGKLWGMTALITPEGAEEELDDINPWDYTIVFGRNGIVQVQADCIASMGGYAFAGGFAGGVAIQLGPTILMECEPGSLAQPMLSALGATQDYRVRPGGTTMELILPAGGGSLVFTDLGVADAPPPDTGEPPTDLATPAPDKPMGRVTGQSGVNIRTGPGTYYTRIGWAPYGAESEIIGQSADREWWVIPVSGAPNDIGWVASVYIEATNAQNVPIFSTPPPPTPTLAPTVEATAVPEIDFWADRTTINEGECATLSWRAVNIQAIWMYPQGAGYQDYPVTGEGSQQECPATTTTYELRVLKPDGAVELRQITIKVKATQPPVTPEPDNPLAGTSWVLSSMYVNQVPIPGTALTLYFAPDLNLSGNGGCNTFGGSYAVDGSSLTIGNLAPTQSSCGEDIDQQESLYLSALQSAASFELSGIQLIVRDGGGQEVLRFNR